MGKRPANLKISLCQEQKGIGKGRKNNKKPHIVPHYQKFTAHLDLQFENVGGRVLWRHCKPHVGDKQKPFHRVTTYTLHKYFHTNRLLIFISFSAPVFSLEDKQAVAWKTIFHKAQRMTNRSKPWSTPAAELEQRGEPVSISEGLRFGATGDGEESWQQMLWMWSDSSLERNTE